MLRFNNGYLIESTNGIDLDKIRKDFSYGGVDGDDASDQLRSWFVNGGEAVEFDGNVWTILRFGSEKIRTAVAEGRASQAMPSDDEEGWYLAASTVIRGHNRHGWAEEYSTTCRRRLKVAEYRSLTHEEWVSAKNALQQLIAAGEGWRLDPSKPEFKGYEAMFGLMARAVWNAARCCHGQELSIPSAEAISAECEKLIRRWELRRMI